MYSGTSYLAYQKDGLSLCSADEFYPLETPYPDWAEQNPNDSYKLIAEKLFSSITDGLQDTLKLIDFEQLEKAVQLIKNAHQICVYGFGNSFTVCQDIETRFMRFGIPIKAYNDLHMQVTASSLLTEKDLIICVSHTGANIDLLQAIELAHNNNVPIIAITSYMNSPLCKLSDVVLHGMGREIAYKSEAVASRLIHMAIVDILYMGVYQKNVTKSYFHYIIFNLFQFFNLL